MKKLVMAAALVCFAYSTPASADYSGDCKVVYTQLKSAVQLYVERQNKLRSLMLNNKVMTDEFSTLSDYAASHLDDAAKLAQVFSVYCD